MIWRAESDICITDKMLSNNGDQDHPGDGAQIVPASAQNAGAAKDHRSDRRQQEGITHRLIGFAGVAGQHRAGERGAGTAGHERDYQNCARADAGQVRDPLAVADGIDVAAEWRATQRHDDQHAD